MHFLVWLGGGRLAGTMAGTDRRNVEGAVLRHAGKLALASADRERLRVVVPLEANRRPIAFLVTEAIVSAWRG